MLQIALLIIIVRAPATLLIAAELEGYEVKYFHVSILDEIARSIK